jgi:hypothetical protein
MRRARLAAVLPLLGTVLVLGVAACGGDAECEANDAMTVELSQQNDSGQTGTVTLTPTGVAETTVTMELSNPPDVPQPVHIHEGSCAELGAVAFPLDNLEGGTSETVVEVSLDELQSGDFAVNAHESEETIDNYVACGDIP